MAKEYYDKKIGPTTDWGGDSSTGGLQVKGSRVQEYIKGEFKDLHDGQKTASEDSVRDIVRNYTPDDE